MSARQYIAIMGGSVLLVQSSSLAAAEEKPKPQRHYQLRWGDLAPHATGRKVRVALADRTRIEGRALAVEADSLVMEITKTSNRQAYAKGRGSIPRTAVSELRVTRMKGYTGRVVGASILGVPGSFYVGYLATEDAGNPDVWAPGAVCIAGLTALGYYLGWRAGREITTITVVP